MVQLEVQDARQDKYIPVPPIELLQRWINVTYASEEATELVLRVVDPEEIQDLNRTYRGKPYPTNVLSFPFEAPPEIPLAILGDIVICASVLESEANDQGKPLEAHWAHMVVHGILHLMGFDHIEASDATTMEAREVAILETLGYANPYLE